jgi:cytochrome oxidase Cu insertion factor (SCO1/SenC/PrrC family)
MVNFARLCRFPVTMLLPKVRFMRKALLTTAVGCLLIAAALCPLSLQAQQPKQPPAPMKLKVGDMAPDFKVQYFDGAKVQNVSLSDFKGKKNVALAFFVLAFTGG